MQFQKIDNSYIVHVEKGEKVMDTLTQFCIDRNITSGQLSGIGAVKNVDIGAYNITSKEYIHKIFDSILELLSFQGNVAIKDDEPFIHAHITLGNHDMEVSGGHLFEMEVAAVGEFIIHDFKDKTHRVLNEDIGLATLSLCKI
jgi:predicted DNA-binding protein with PD1-like motif|tara:strand:+ start:19 stop:447 length:429 start_codon:yes stop_codon:yes gene_type:complete